MIDGLKSLNKIVKNILSTKDIIEKEFRNYVSETKELLKYDEDLCQRFIELNSEFFKQEPINPHEIVSKFDDLFAEELDKIQQNIFIMLFRIRNHMMLLEKDDEEWFLDLYKRSRDEIQKNISETYKKYLNELKEIYIKNLFTNAISDIFSSNEEDDDDSDDENPFDQQSLLETLKKKIKGGLQ